MNVLAEKTKWMKAREKTGLDGLLGFNFKTLSNAKVIATFKITKDLLQPFGLLHGGVHLAFAESLASIGAWLNVDSGDVVGVELSGNHLRALKSGIVTGTAKPLHIGRRTQVWEIKITQARKLVHVAKCTLMAIHAK